MIGSDKEFQLFLESSPMDRQQIYSLLYHHWNIQTRNQHQVDFDISLSSDGILQQREDSHLVELSN